MKKYQINVIRWNLEKYNSTPTFFQKFQILLLMENANTHLVSVFKDYLLYDDMSEFFKEYYNTKEIYTRLKTIFEYYESSSYLFPNYTAIDEGKYIYRNILKKQRLIDYLEDLEDKQNQKEEKRMKKNNKIDNFENDQSSSSYSDVFNTKIYNNIIKETGNDSKINELFCIGNKNNENNQGDSIASLVKLAEEIKEKENIENKENKDINIKNNINNSKNNFNDNSNINNRSKNKDESKIYVLKRLSLKQNSSNSKKIFKKAKANINVNKIITKNSFKKNINNSFKKRNQNLNSIYSSNKYMKNNLSSTGSINNKDYKKNNIIINIINNNKTNNYQSNINYYSNYNSNNQTENNKSNLIPNSNNKYYNTSNNNQIYSTTNNHRSKNSSLTKENELKSVIIKHSHVHSKNISKKLKKEIKSKLLSFHLTTDYNLNQRIKKEKSELKQVKTGKDLSQTKSIISPKNNMKKRTKTEILGTKTDKIIFTQANEINAYNYNKSMNRQILKNINSSSNNRPHNEISLTNKKMLGCQFDINSSKIEKKYKNHTSANSQNSNKIKIINTISPLPLKEIIKKNTGIFFSNKTERNSRNHSKDNIIKINTMAKRNHLDSFSPKKTEEFIYKKIKRLYNKNSAIVSSFLKSVSSNKKIRALKINHKNNLSSNIRLKDIDIIANNNNKELINRLNNGKNC